MEHETRNKTNCYVLCVMCYMLHEFLMLITNIKLSKDLLAMMLICEFYANLQIANNYSPLTRGLGGCFNSQFASFASHSHIGIVKLKRPLFQAA